MGLSWCFEDLLHGELVTIEQVLQEVEGYAFLIIGTKEKKRFIFVPFWPTPPYEVSAS